MNKKKNKVVEYYEKSNLILEYLKNTFKAKNIIKEENINVTNYHLTFGYEGIGISLSNEIIIMSDIEMLYRYSYELVFKQLIALTKRHYLQNGSEE